jgi:hypothetical protein
VNQALRLLEQEATESAAPPAAAVEPLVELLIRRLRRCRGMSGTVVLDWIRTHAPDRLREAHELALGSSAQELRAHAVGQLLDGDDVARRPGLARRAAQDRADMVRLELARRLGRLDPRQRIDIGLELLRDRAWDVRRSAIRTIGDHPLPEIVDQLLPLARDPDEDVRQEALRALRVYDDARVLSELVSSLRDPDDDVRRLAGQLLDEKSGPLAALERIRAAAEPRPGAADGSGRRRHAAASADRAAGATPRPGRPAGVWWQAITDRVEAINRWSSDIGRELLGVPVRVVQYRQGLGRTGARRVAGLVEIEVSDAPVTSDHPHGEDIMRGLALHEIGHHLCDYAWRGFRTANGIARSEGVGEIFDILLDERLERILRSRRPEWGVYFDRLASYAFSQNRYDVEVAELARLLDRSVDEVIRAIRGGELPGRLVSRDRRAHLETDEPADRPEAGEGGLPPTVVQLREQDMLRLPGVLPPLSAFLLCLRGGFDARELSDPRIAEAIARIPPDLRRLRHGRLLVIAREIADLIGRSEQHRRERQRLRSRMWRWRGALRALQAVFDRMEQSGMGRGLVDDDGRPLPLGSLRPPSPGRHARRARHRPTWHTRHPEFPLPSPDAFDRRPEPLNLDPGAGFDPLRHEIELPFDPGRHAELVGSIRPHVRVLRSYFERLGLRDVEEYAMRRGRRIDIAQVRKSPTTRSINLLVRGDQEIRPDAYIGILIDRSGSMQMHKIQRARAFGALLCEAARGLRGLEGHVNAFDHDTFYVLGSFDRNAIASLEAGGGNNDAGGLSRAAELALRSRKRHRLLVMISDGAPTECTFEALKTVVERLIRREGIVCAQAAVAPMHEIAFPDFVDLSKYGAGEAVARFGRLLMRLTRGWR